MVIVVLFSFYKIGSIGLILYKVPITIFLINLCFIDCLRYSYYSKLLTFAPIFYSVSIINKNNVVSIYNSAAYSI